MISEIEIETQDLDGSFVEETRWGCHLFALAQLDLGAVDARHQR